MQAFHFLFRYERLINKHTHDKKIHDLDLLKQFFQARVRMNGLKNLKHNDIIRKRALTTSCSLFTTLFI